MISEHKQGSEDKTNNAVLGGISLVVIVRVG